MKREIKILSTLGPSSMETSTIKKLDDMGVGVFRINLSHTPLDQIEKNVKHIIASTDKPLCLDLEGAQVRSGLMANNRDVFEEGGVVRIHKDPLVGDAKNINLTPSFVVDEIEPGDLISIDFDTLLLHVYKREGETLLAKVVSGGTVGSNKAVTVDRNIILPPLSPKDKEAVVIGLKHKVPYIALSFANRKSDVEELRALVGDKMKIISKIESRDGLRNLEEILIASDAALIDRGDMSREVSIELIPSIQKRIIKKANDLHTPIYVATNLLESMVDRPVPTRAEVNDIINTLLDGANGLVLAAETAIGRYPVECVNMVRRLSKAFNNTDSETTLMEMANQEVSSLHLNKPHGGVMVNKKKFTANQERIAGLRKLFVDETVLLDVQQIAVGTYSPVDGFMNRDEIHSVLDDYKLPSGDVWTLPICLQAKKEDIKHLRVGDEIALVSKRDDVIYAVLHLDDVYNFDFNDISQKWFNTTDKNHPGVNKLSQSGECFLGGKVDLIRRLPSEYQQYTLTPLQTRQIFEKKGWNTIVGFHTRNVVHRAHEFLQLTALDRYGIDGLFVHPIIGPKKKNDYNPDVILKSYSMMMDQFYPKNHVVLGAFLSYSRYAGPREAVFTALCRKNFGCTHFIVGRDHTGVGDFYSKDASKELFGQLGDIGIQPVFFDEVHYCQSCKLYVEKCDHAKEDIKHISGTQAREMFSKGEQPPAWFMREEISRIILEDITNQKEVFVT